MLRPEDRAAIAGQDAELPEMRRRARVFGILVVLGFLGLATRLFYLQVLQGDAFYRLTSESIVRTVPRPAIRGEIRDRRGKILARMRPSYDLVATPKELSPGALAAIRLSAGLSPEQAALASERIEGERKRDKAHTIVIAEDVSRDSVVEIETSLENAGVKIVAAQRRHYPFGSLAGHVLGFMNEVSADELHAKREDGYGPGDLIGRTGIERQWEAYLRGRDGFDRVVVDRSGVKKTGVSLADLVDGAPNRAPVPGNNVILTLDIELQRLAERALRGHPAGAAVVLEVDTGRILAMVSKPELDSNKMSGHLSAEEQAKILADRYHPLRDKVVGETYFPGSTFKVVTALAALDSQVVTPTEKVICRGFVERGGRRFRDHKLHGSVDLKDAIVQSCNVYFYELGVRPGMLDRMATVAMDLGLGAPTGLGLNGDAGGFIPTEGWYRARKGRDPKSEGSGVGEALNTAIGQGSLRVSVLQMALLYAAIGNGGKLWLPQLVERIESPTGQVFEDLAPRMRREVSASTESLALVREALAGVVNDFKGTAYRARIGDVVVAGKTGTAQVTKLRRRGAAQSAGGEENDHAWFAGYAPADRPRIAFAVLVEHGGFGGEVAAPIATEIMRGYFNEIEPSFRDGSPLGLPRSPKAPVSAPGKTHPTRREKTDRKASLSGDGGGVATRHHMLTNAPLTILRSP
jgi:penicillin-binding protein 2